MNWSPNPKLLNKKSYHAGGSVMSRDIISKILLSDGFNIFSRPKDGAPKSGVLKCSRMQMIKNHLLDLAFYLHTSVAPHL